MDYFKGLKNVIAPVQSDFVDIDKVLARIQQSTLPEVKRNALQEIGSLSKTHQLEVGLKTTPVLLSLIETERNDVDMLATVMEVLVSVMTNLSETNNHGSVNSELLVQESAIVESLVGVLDETDMYVRLNLVKLIATLLQNKPNEMQSAIMQTPNGVARLVDVLSDKREAIRNEGLLCMTDLIKNNEELQKIVVFEGLLEMLLDIVADEGGVSGGVVVQDCLALVISLMEGHPSTQNYFRETSCVARLPGLLKVTADSTQLDIGGVAAQSSPVLSRLSANLVSVLSIVGLMLEPTNPTLTLNQTTLFQSGVFSMVGDLALGPHSSPRTPPVRAQALLILGYLIRGNKALQNALASASVASDDGTGGPISALQRTLSLSLFTKEKTVSAAAALTFRAYLQNNPDAQVAIASTVLPTDTGASSDTPGRMMVRTLMEWEDGIADPMHTWHAASVLCAVLHDNDKAKEILSSTPLDVTTTESHQLLLRLAQAITHATRLNSHMMIRFSLFKALCYWLNDYQPAIDVFLASSSRLSFIVEVIQAQQGGIHVCGLSALLLGICMVDGNGVDDVVRQRVGISVLHQRMEAVRMSPEFSATSGVTADAPALYGDGFAAFFSDTCGRIQQQLSGIESVTPSNNESESLRTQLLECKTKINELSAELSANKLQSHDSPTDVDYVVKQAVRERDTEIAILHKKTVALSELASKNESEVAALRAQLDSSVSNEEVAQLRQSLENAEEEVSVLSGAYNELEATCHDHESTIERLKTSSHNDAQIRELTEQLERSQARTSELEAALQHKQEQYDELAEEHDELLLVLADQEEEGDEVVDSE